MSILFLKKGHLGNKKCQLCSEFKNINIGIGLMLAKKCVSKKRSGFSQIAGLDKGFFYFKFFFGGGGGEGSFSKS